MQLRHERQQTRHDDAARFPKLYVLWWHEKIVWIFQTHVQRWNENK